MLLRDLSIDPLTQLNSIIKFINCDFEHTFGQRGNFILFDIKYLKRLNTIKGRTFGDAVIRKVADILKETFLEDSIYRLEGDSFLVIVKNNQYPLVERKVKSVILSFHEDLKNHGIYFSGLNYNIYLYNDYIRSVSDFYIKVAQEDSSHVVNTERFACHIIEGVVGRLNEALKHYERAYDYAMIDDITQLPNSKAAQQFIQKRKDHGQAYAVVFIDGDNLSLYNDINYETGNQMIKKLGQIIRSSVRDDDKVFRWLSGDEFIIFLKGASKAQGMELTESIRKRVEASRKDFIFPTTISCGVSYYPDDDRSFMNLIQKSETAMKHAKKSGKNKVVEWQLG